MAPLLDRIIEFSTNHVLLVGSWVGLLGALFVIESRRGGETLTSQQVTNLINGEGALVLDVRDPKDFQAGHITGSTNIPFNRINERIGEIEHYKDKPVVLVCAMGQHAGMVGRILHTKGFKNVRRLAGGISTWKTDGLPLVKAKK
ncbi:MAG TPA: rhodanese-like domain-containing protein [Pseudomonadales bacterium]|nr:rhodanese-like domain-containing protein [Pseudomonadales bacterium]